MSWIGVDFDGVLAEYDSGSFPKLGKPIPAMVDRVKRWLADGYEVRIVTARVDDVQFNRYERCYSFSKRDDEEDEQRRLLKIWCIEHIGQELAVTNAKDFDMIVLYDDRCRQVIKNTGEIVGGEFELRPKNSDMKNALQSD